MLSNPPLPPLLSSSFVVPHDNRPGTGGDWTPRGGQATPRRIATPPGGGGRLPLGAHFASPAGLDQEGEGGMTARAVSLPFSTDVCLSLQVMRRCAFAKLLHFGNIFDAPFN